MKGVLFGIGMGRGDSGTSPTPTLAQVLVAGNYMGGTAINFDALGVNQIGYNIFGANSPDILYSSSAIIGSDILTNYVQFQNAGMILAHNAIPPTIQFNQIGVNVGNLTTAALSATRTWTLPDADGTIALTSSVTNLGNTNLTSSDATRTFTLSGNTTGQLFKFMNSTISLLTIQGNGTVFSNGVGGISSNTMFGELTGAGITTGFDNTFMGYSAGSATQDGQENVFIGSNAGLSNLTGDANVAIGTLALASAQTADNNTAIGYNALRSMTAAGNTAVGRIAGRYQANGSSANTTGTNSVFIGFGAKANANAETNQIVIGYNAIGKGANTSVLGGTSTTQAWIYGAFYSETNTKQFILNGATASNKLEITNGTNAVLHIAGNNTTWCRGAGNVTQNCAFGELALDANTTGQYNAAFGYNALTAVTDGVQNTGLGYGTAMAVTTGDYNTAVGFNAHTLGNSSHNTCIGNQAGALGTTSDYNVIIGSIAAYNTAGLGQHTIIGYNAGNTLGANSQYLVGIGANALFGAGNSTQSVAVGNSTLTNVVGSYNVAIGYQAGTQYGAGTTMTAADASIFIGRTTRASGNTETNQIVIGDSATGKGSNTTVIGNTSAVTAYIRGAVIIGDEAALNTTATVGFLHVPSCAGTPTGVPTLYTGKIPVVADSTNNKLYIYSGGAWVALN